MYPYSIISHDEVLVVHEATLRILDETGIVLTHPEGWEFLTSAGAVVESDRVRIPADLVETCLSNTPNQVLIRGRGGTVVTLGDGALHWHNMGGARDIYDPKVGQARAATVDDVRRSTLLLDSMAHVSAITPLFTPRDVPAHLTALAMYRHTLPNTTKPVHGPGVASAKEVHYAVRMAEVFGTPSEVLTLPVSPVSPLTFPDPLVESIIAIARHRVPFSPLPSPTCGATAPVTLAGALAQQNAEILAAIVIAQLVQPGLPVIYSGRLAVMDPRTAASIWGGIELGMASAATVQLGHHYSLPVNVYGFATNSHDYDVQNGYERALNAMLPVLAGADELSGIGQLGAGVISSFAQLVLDNEIAGSIKRAKRGLTVNDDTLAVDVIRDVLDESGNFMAEQHTVNHLRSREIHRVGIAERRDWNTWDESGRIGMVQRALAEAQRVLDEHEIIPLTPEQDNALEEILAAADADLCEESG